MNKILIRYGLIAGYLYLLIVPGFIFLSIRPGLPLTRETLFPLGGLYAFTLVAMQVIIGSNMRRLRPIMGAKILKFHRYQGLFALSFALIHPFMAMSVLGISESLSRPYVAYGALAAGLLLLTVGTAAGAWKLNQFGGSWRFIHFGNYAVFILAWLHSWFIGSDIQSTPLKYVWLFYLGAWGVSLGLRIAGTKPVKQEDAPGGAPSQM